MGSPAGRGLAHPLKRVLAAGAEDNPEQGCGGERAWVSGIFAVEDPQGLVLIRPGFGGRLVARV